MGVGRVPPYFGNESAKADFGPLLPRIYPPPDPSEAMLFQAMRRARRTMMGEPSATKAEEGGAVRGPANSAP